MSTSTNTWSIIDQKHLTYVQCMEARADKRGEADETAIFDHVGLCFQAWLLKNVPGTYKACRYGVFPCFHSNKNKTSVRDNIIIILNKAQHFQLRYKIQRNYLQTPCA